MGPPALLRHLRASHLRARRPAPRVLPWPRGERLGPEALATDGRPHQCAGPSMPRKTPGANSNLAVSRCDGAGAFEPTRPGSCRAVLDGSVPSDRGMARLDRLCLRPQALRRVALAATAFEATAGALAEPGERKRVRSAGESPDALGRPSRRAPGHASDRAPRAARPPARARCAGPCPP